MGIGTKQVRSVTVSSTATGLAPERASRAGIALFNNGAGVVYLGGPDVTAASGFPLPAGASFSEDGSRDAYYGVTASGTVDVRVLEIV
jgi:hypothetical protein